MIAVFHQKKAKQNSLFLDVGQGLGWESGFFVVDEIIISLARMMINRRKMSRNDEDSRNSSDSCHSLLD